MSALSPFTRPWYASASASLLVGTLAWLSTRFGVLDPLDAIAYDACLALRSSIRSDLPKVLLLDTPPAKGPVEGAALRTVLSELDRLGPAAVVVAAEILPPGEGLVDTLLSGGERVVVARTVSRDREGEGGWVVEPCELEGPSGRVEWGAAIPPEPAGGTVRRHPLFAGEGAQRCASVELVAARKALGDPGFEPGDAVLVDFRGGPESLPRLSFERAVRGDLVPEIVRRMCVLIGPAQVEGVGVPTPGGGGPMSVLEFRGHVLDTLLASGGIRRVGDGWLLGALLGASLVSGLAYRFLNVRGYLRFGASAMGLPLAASALLAARAGVWLPAAGFCLSQALLLVGSLARSSGNLARAMEQFTSDAASQLRDKYWPLVTFSNEPPWAALAKMIYQTLDITRMVFFEVVPGERRMRFVHGLNAARADVEERRLDYHRAPYITALAQGGTIRVEKFFARASLDEVQYLSPLLLGDELLGFWVLAVEAKKANAISGFEGLVRQYGHRIADLLYHARRRRADFAHASARGAFRGGENVETLSRELKGALSLLGDRLKTLESLIDRLEFGVIVFDVFGRVLQINEPMLRGLKREGLKPFEMTALDLVLNLSDYDLTTARKLMRRVIVEDASVSFPAALRATRGQRFRVNLKPLRGEAERGSRAGESPPQSWGILWEFLDTSSIALAYELKQELVDHMVSRLRNDLGAIGLGSGLFRNRFLLQEQKVRIAELLETKVRSGAELLSDCGRYLSSRAEEDELETVPVDPRLALRAAFDGLVETLNERKLTTELEEPFHVSLVLASRTKLEALFRRILETLAADSGEGGAIRTVLKDREEAVTLEFSNTGFGIPNDVFQEYLRGTGLAIGDNFKALREAVETVRRWGGTLEGRSEVGEGMRFEVHLTKFL
ncbi:MAG: CHASE2 domain-containing protein [Planctomycetota bacterium]